jgi:hypothetical protein
MMGVKKITKFKADFKYANFIREKMLLKEVIANTI